MSISNPSLHLKQDKKEPFMIHLLQTKTKKFAIQERINYAKIEHNYTLLSMLEKL